MKLQHTIPLLLCGGLLLSMGLAIEPSSSSALLDQTEGSTAKDEVSVAASLKKMMRGVFSSLQAADVDGETSKPTTFRGLLTHWYGPINYNALEGWIKYHQKRWALTDVDIFLPESHLNDASSLFGDTYEGVKVNILSNGLSETEAKADILVFRAGKLKVFAKGLENARREKNDYLINFDPDEYLISDDFDSLAEMFTRTNRSAISFPLFQNNYHRCSDNRLTFGSATFQSLRPHGSHFVNDTKLEYYTDPPRACDAAQRKYIVMPDKFRVLPSPHDPFGCYREEKMHRPPFTDITHYMTGRKADGEHARVLHMRTDVGIFSDVSMNACLQVRTCPYLNAFGNCVDSIEKAEFINSPSSMNFILKDFPIYNNSSQFSADAICYAKRYPDLLQGYCNGDPTQCLYGALWSHYLDHGRAGNLLWGCRYRPVEPAIPVGSFPAARGDGDDGGMKLHFLIFETAEKGSEEEDTTLIEQSLAAGIRTTRIGRGVRFEGFSSKWRSILAYLKSLSEDSNTLVVVTDARDVLLNIHDDFVNSEESTQHMIDHFIGSYKSITAAAPGAVVMSAEAQCCVSALTYAEPGSYFHEDGSRFQRACASGSEGCLWGGDSKVVSWEDFQIDLAVNRTGRSLRDVYLNAGLAAGRPVDWIRLLEAVDLESYEDDQAVFTEYMYHRPDQIVLDYASEMFGTARWPLGMTDTGCPFGKGNFSADQPEYILPALRHLESDSMPLLLHTPGKFFACYDFLAEELGLVDEDEDEEHEEAEEEEDDAVGAWHDFKETVKGVRGTRFLQQQAKNNKNKNQKNKQTKQPKNPKETKKPKQTKKPKKTKQPKKTKKPRNYGVGLRAFF